jgi:RNA polymerase sigma factor (sigma-70 family)
MSDSLLAQLLEKLREGDSDAADGIFRQYEPYLRMVVRRKISPALRAKFDSVDVIQSVWADLFQGFRDARWSFEDPSKLKAFLITAARNRLIDYVRRNRHAVGNNVSGLPVEEAATDDPRPSELIQADDVWQQLLSLCSDEHKAIVELKRRGLSLDEIAERTKYHKSSVRRILYDLSRKLNSSKLPASDQ